MTGPIVNGGDGNEIEKLIENDAEANNNGRVMRLSATARGATGGCGGGVGLEPKEAKACLGHARNLSIGLRSLFCGRLIMAKAKDKLEIYCYCWSKRKEGSGSGEYA